MNAIRRWLWLLPLAAVVLVAMPTSAATGTSVTPGVVTGAGLGFDICNAPRTAVVRAWSSPASPYSAVNIYFGGSQRACKAQPELSPDWVTTVLSNGWSIIPTYVDLQAPAPCYGGSAKSAMSNDPATAAQQGTAAANDANAQLQALGLGGTIAYLDLEPFDTGKDPSCAPAVTAFVDAWTQTLHASNTKSGVYVNAHHGAQMFVDAYATDANRPDDIWVADWNGKAVADDDVLQGTWPHHRIHQYHGGKSETYAGETLTVDGNAIDGDVVSARSVTTPTGPPYTYYVIGTPSNNLNERAAPNSSSTIAATAQNGDPLPVLCQTAGESVDGDPVWDKLASGYYVSDLYTTTTGRNGFSAALPKCDRSPPTASLRRLPLATLASTVTVAWDAADSPDADGNPSGEPRGILSSELRYRVASWHGGFGGWRTLRTKGTSARVSLAAGYAYCFQVRSFDLSGNASAWSARQCLVRALDDRSVAAGSAWSRRTGSRYYLHTFTATPRTGVTMSRTKAQVARVGVVATTCNHCGVVRVYVAGRYVGTINLHGSTTKRRNIFLLKPFSLRSGTVTVKTMNSRLVEIDGLVISRT